MNNEINLVMCMADGMEECECLVTVDLLRRAGIKVSTASVMGRKRIVSTHNIPIEADCLIEEIDFSNQTAIVLPGGLPGADYLKENTVVRDMCKQFAADDNKLVAAICAAPRNLASWGLLESKPATVYPGLESDMCGAIITNTPVAHAGNIITGRSLGGVFPFALEIIASLCNLETAEQIKKEICL